MVVELHGKLLMCKVGTVYIMKMLLVSNMYPSDTDPQHGIYVQNVKEALVTLAHWEVLTAVIRGKSRHRFAKGYKYLRFFLDTFVRVLGSRYDIVYVQYLSHAYVPLLFLGPWRSGKLVVHVHGGDILREEHVTRFYFALKRFVSSKALQSADLIVVPSHYYKDIVTKEFQVVAEKVFIYSSGGVDMRIFHKTTGIQRDSGFVLGYVGRLEKDKGVGTLLQALDILRDTLPDMRTIIIGKGTMEQELRAFVKDHSLEERVAFLGVMKQSELVRYYNRMDVFIFPTERHTESLGLVGLEAMACGVPVIGTEIGGLVEYLQDSYNGFFFALGSAVDLAHKIVQFYHLDGFTRSRLSENAIATAQRYDSEVEHRRLLKALETMIG
jgi:glycosyltransferase involved in cell wall biosynthesis